jgi:PAS domain S-box-containing protein
VQKGAETRSVFSDLTHKIRISVAKVRTERALLESESRYRSLIDGSSVGIFLTDVDSHCIYSNRKWLEMTSQTEAEAKGGEWMERIHPEDRISFASNWEHSIENGGAYSFEYRYLGPEGKTTWIWSNAAPLKSIEGRITGFISTNVDITERKRAEAELVEKERTIAKASSLAKIGYWIWKAEKGTITSSDGLTALLGIPAGTVLPHDHFFQMIHPDDRMMVIDALEQTLKGKGDFYIEHRMLRSDGSTIIVKDTVEVTSAKGNRPLFILGVVQDITETNGLNRELVAIKECNRALFKAGTEQELLDEVCRIVCEVAGYQMAWIGYAQNDPARSIRPAAWSRSGQRYVSQARATWGDDERGNGPSGTSIKTQRTVFVQDFAQDTSTGPWRDLARKMGYRSSIAIPLLHPGGVFGAFMLYSDQINGFTTDEVKLLEELASDLAFGIMELRARQEHELSERALRASESRLRTLVQTIPDLVWLKDADGIYLTCNSVFERFFGAKESDIVGKTDYDFLDRDLADFFRKNDRTAMEAGMPTTNDEWVVFKDDGHRAYLETIMTPMIDEQGMLIGVLGLGRDMTNRKLVEDALHEANRKLNILSGVTRHDIRNQLMALSGNLTLFMKKQTAYSSDENLKKAEAAARRISAMIQFTKEYEDIGIRIPIWQDVRDLVNTTFHDSQSEKVALVNEIPDGMEVFADPLITKVFHNLIDNAVRHGGRVTTIRFSVEDRRDERTIICEDDGAGISGEIKNNLFARGDLKDHGFGLFISREILAITGITISEESRPGQGARFALTIPPGKFR